MCGVPIIFSAMSAILGGVSSFAGIAQEAENARRARDYQSAVAQNAANVANAKIKYIQDEGAKRIQQARDEKASLLGKIKAIRGASGVTLNGSPTDSLISIERQGQYDINNIREGVARDVWNTRVGANENINSSNYAISSTYQSPLGSITGALAKASNQIGGIYEKIEKNKLENKLKKQQDQPVAVG